MDNLCYLFDFDGTLVDSMPSWAESMRNILRLEGIAIPPDLIRIITPLGNAGAADYYIQTLGVKSTKESLVEKMESFAYSYYEKSIPSKATVYETLIELKKRGASLNVLTASPHKTLDVCLERVDLWKFFDNIWSCNDFQTTKTDPFIYSMAAEKLGKNVSDCIFLDDNINALQAAKKAGMQVIGVYDASSVDDQMAIRKLCGRYITYFKELL